MSNAPMVIDCSDAKEFIKELLPLSDELIADQFIYRGHGKAEWPLVPTLFRSQIWKAIHDDVSRSDDSDWRKLKIEYERNIFKNFITECDLQGIRLPEDSESFRSYLTHLSTLTTRNDWPPPFFHANMAMAQHYSIPTRLLDWTERPFVAAYFAASDRKEILEKELTENDRIAVWRFNIGAMQNYSPSNIGPEGKKYNKVRFIKVPGIANRNLVAQAGCFTITDMEEEEGPARGLENVDGDHLEHLCKITVPASQFDDILDFCKKVGCTGGTLFPDLTGIARTVHESLFRMRN